MNGYELRLEMVKLAKELVMDKFFSEKEQISTNYFSFVEANKNIPEHILERELVFPEFPSIDEIIKQADIFNEFVVKK